MERLFWICLAGAAGTGVRHLVALWAAQRLGTGFPYGTMIVNVSGCFLISLVMQSASAFAWTPTVRAALTIGFLGGFTTYSSFNYETTGLAQQGAFDLATLNAAGTVLGGFAAGWLGLLASRQLTGQ